MEQRNTQTYFPPIENIEGLSPYRTYSAKEWSKFRADTPLTLTEDEVRRLHSLNDPI